MPAPGCGDMPIASVVGFDADDGRELAADGKLLADDRGELALRR